MGSLLPEAPWTPLPAHHPSPSPQAPPPGSSPRASRPALSSRHLQSRLELDSPAAVAASEAHPHTQSRGGGVVLHASSTRGSGAATPRGCPLSDEPHDPARGAHRATRLVQRSCRWPQGPLTRAAQASVPGRTPGSHKALGLEQGENGSSSSWGGECWGRQNEVAPKASFISHTHTHTHTHTYLDTLGHTHVRAQEATHPLREKPDGRSRGAVRCGPLMLPPRASSPPGPPGRWAYVFTAETAGTDWLNQSVEGNCA